MEIKLKKWGNSQGIIIPKSVCEYLGIQVGDKLTLERSSGTVLLRPKNNSFARSRKVTAAELFAQNHCNYEPPSDWPSAGNEIDWGKSAGNELSL